MAAATESPANDLSRAEKALDARLARDAADLGAAAELARQLLRGLRRGTLAHQQASDLHLKLRTLLSRAQGRA